TYIFPLPDRAAVTAFRMEVGDRVVEGELKERAEAREAYEQAIEAGQRAAIAEEERPNVFTVRVGNLMPGDRAVVELELTGAPPAGGPARTPPGAARPGPLARGRGRPGPRRRPRPTPHPPPGAPPGLPHPGAVPRPPRRRPGRPARHRAALPPARRGRGQDR